MVYSRTRGSDRGAAPKAPTIWAIASGKGGVGKSVVASSVAIAFANRGHRCAMIDLDLGAANQHTLLGVARPRFTLSDFLDRKVKDLSDVLSCTPYANLDLVSGARASLAMANPKHSQKEKILRHIRELDCDHVFLDLGAGCAYNALDFFLAADRRVVVVVPERTSIENTQNFLRTAFYRSLRVVAKREQVRNAIFQVLGSESVHSARELIHGVTMIDSEAGAVLASRAAEFAPMLVINKLESSEQRQICSEIALACRHYLTAGVRALGGLPRDQRVRDAVSQGRHVLELFPGSRFSVALHSLATELIDETPAHSQMTPSSEDDELRGGTAPEAELPEIDVAAPGADLRRCREHRGWSLQDVIRRTRIRSLASIEREQFDELPPDSYVVAFVRQYAQALGIREFERLTKCYVERYRVACVHNKRHVEECPSSLSNSSSRQPS